MDNSEKKETLVNHSRLKMFNPFFSSIAELLSSHSQKFPDKQAIIALEIDRDEEYSLSYKQLLVLVYKTANFLFQKGVRKSDRIAFLFYNCSDILILELAAGLLGASSVPLGFKRDAQERKIFKLKDAEVKFFFLKTDEEDIKEEVDAIKNALPAMEIVLLWGLKGLEQIVGNQPVDPLFTLNDDLESEFVLLYTSGTTADPKGVPLTLRACFANAQAVMKWQNFTAEERFQIVLPLHHINSTIFFLTTFLVGGTIILYSRYSVSRFWRTVEQYKVTGTSIGATIIHDLLAKKEDYFAKSYNISSLKKVLIGSSPILPDEAMRFVDTFRVRVFQGWGQTESAFRATGVSADLSEAQYREAVKTNTIGVELENCDTTILKEDGSEARVGEEGELCTRGPGVTERYLNNPEETGKTFFGGWRHSGDLGFYKIVDGQKFFFIKGRIKEIIIKGGVNISPVVIEDALLKNFPEIDEVCVVGYFDKRMVEEIAAVVLFKEHYSPEQKRKMLEAIVEYGKNGKSKEIAKYESPSRAFEIKEGLPKTSTGKIQRVRVKELVKQWINEEKQEDPVARSSFSKDDIFRRKIEIVRSMFHPDMILALERVGLLGRLVKKGEIVISELPEGEFANDNVRFAFEYLACLGYVILDRQGERVTLTPMGDAIFRKMEFMGVPQTYAVFNQSLIDVIRKKKKLERNDINVNIDGSGKTHQRFFELAESMMRESDIDAIVDIGCGNGDALIHAFTVNKGRPDIRYIGIDLNREAVKSAKERFQRIAGKEGLFFEGDISNPEDIAQTLEGHGVSCNRTVVMSFFIMHEVLGFPNMNAVDLLDRYHNLFRPRMVFAEIFDIPWWALENAKEQTVAPEYLLFHRYSGQHPISYNSWRDAIEKSRWQFSAFHAVGRPIGDFNPPYFWSGVFELISSN